MAEEQGGAGQKLDSIPFHYIKSNFFRVVRADGAVGGLNPQGVIQAAIYNERIPIPQRTVQKVNPDGTLGDDLPDQRIIRDGLVREVEVELMFTVESARNFATWLLGHIAMAEKHGVK